MAERTRPCPVEGCDTQVPRSRVLCRPHWYAVPKHLRDEVWRWFRTAPGSGVHLQAILAAVEAVNDKQATKTQEAT